MRARRTRSTPGLAGVLATALALGAAACGGEPPGSVAATLSVPGVLAGADTAGYARATEIRAFRFPEDHGPHPAYRTEWWYVTGNVETDRGRRFGYQLTFFRSALSPSVPDRPSPWAANQVYMGHFAVTDPEAGDFLAAERFSRSALGLAGARARPFRVWLEDWSLEGTGDAPFPVRLRAATDRVTLELVLERGKPVVLQGREGLSRKGEGAGNASYYYSLTRMPTVGRLRIGGEEHEVRGLSWLDREWSTSALGPEVEGWDWFSVQLDDDRELMYYRLRRRDGSTDPLSSGSWVGPDGAARGLDAGDVRLEPLEWWESSDGAARYPVAWSLDVPGRGLDLTIRAVLPEQEWRSTFRYWEGAVDVEGTRAGATVSGRGYVELTGYEGAPVPGEGGG